MLEQILTIIVVLIGIKVILKLLKGTIKFVALVCLLVGGVYYYLGYTNFVELIVNILK